MNFLSFAVLALVAPTTTWLHTKRSESAKLFGSLVEATNVFLTHLRHWFCSNSKNYSIRFHRLLGKSQAISDYDSWSSEMSFDLKRLQFLKILDGPWLSLSSPSARPQAVFDVWWVNQLLVTNRAFNQLSPALLSNSPAPGKLQRFRPRSTICQSHRIKSHARSQSKLHNREAIAVEFEYSIQKISPKKLEQYVGASWALVAFSRCRSMKL